MYVTFTFVLHSLLCNLDARCVSQSDNQLHKKWSKYMILLQHQPLILNFQKCQIGYLCPMLFKNINAASKTTQSDQWEQSVLNFFLYTPQQCGTCCSVAVVSLGSVPGGGSYQPVSIISSTLCPLTLVQGSLKATVSIEGSYNRYSNHLSNSQNKALFTDFYQWARFNKTLAKICCRKPIHWIQNMK